MIPVSETELKRPRVELEANAIDQPATVEWGHLTQVRGRLDGGTVRIVRQKRTHTFGSGTTDSGPGVPMYHGKLEEAVEVYRALDALFGEYADTDLESGDSSEGDR